VCACCNYCKIWYHDCNVNRPQGLLLRSKL